MDKPTKSSTFLFSAVCFNTAPSNHARPMSINIDNDFPAIAMWFGPSDDKDIRFNVHIDSCAGLNIGNLRVRQWVITKYPYIVKNYI